MTVPPAATERDPMRRVRIALAVVIVLMLVAAQQLGVLHIFTDPARVKQALVELGPWGYVAFIAAYTALQPFGVPGTVFVFAAPMIWPWPIAYALSMIGTLSASAVGFSFARFMGRAWVSRLIPARFRRYEDALEKRGFVTVFLLRFIFWMPPVLHALFGVSKVRASTHLFASALGYALPLLLVSYFGPRAFDALRAAPAWVWVLVAATVVVGLITWLVRRRSANLVK